MTDSIPTTDAMDTLEFTLRMLDEATWRWNAVQYYELRCARIALVAAVCADVPADVADAYMQGHVTLNALLLSDRKELSHGPS
jgi:hypothetical protein